MLTIILLALGGAVLSAIIGTFWYSMATPMGRLHMKYLGFDKLSPEEQKKKIEEAKPMMWKMYVAQLILSSLTAFATVFIVTMSMQNGLTLSMTLGFVAMNWLCFVVPTIGSALLWSNCDRSIVWQKFFSDIFSSLVTLIVIALLASLFV
jgi:hypothetical protein